MNSRTLTLAVLTSAAAGLSLVTATTAGAGSAGLKHAAANSVTFPTSPPADPNAPAISSAVVSNDDKGSLTFRINIPNRPQLTPDMDIAIFLDTDQNASTGAQKFGGADFTIDLTATSIDLGRWDGSKFDFSKGSPASLIYSYNSGATITVNSGDILPGLAGLNFYAVALSGIAGPPDNPDFTNVHADAAPPDGHGTWNYQIQVAPLQLSVSSLATTPKRPVAGQPFTASMLVKATVPGALAQNAQIACTATIAGRPLRVQAQGLTNGTAVCSWQIPKSARKKLLSGSVSLSAAGLQASKSFSARVR
jgi:hypothetical protein